MPRRILGGLLNNRFIVIPLAMVLLASLSSCSASNEAPCASFESAYNAADLRDKYLFKNEDSFNEALETLGNTAETASTEASGDVELHLGIYAEYARQYIDSRTDLSMEADTINRRVKLSNVRDAIIDSCEDSGNPIELEEDHPVN